MTDDHTISLLKKQKNTFLHLFNLPLMSDDEFASLVDEAACKAKSNSEIDVFLELSQILLARKKR